MPTILWENGGSTRLVQLSKKTTVLRALAGKLSRSQVSCIDSPRRAFEILNLTTREYEEREVDSSPVLSAGKERWNLNGMHHIDAHLVNGEHWFACVDGWFDNRAPKNIHVT